MVSIPSFTLEFIRSRNRSKADKWVWTGLLSLLPIVYILFYDPNTSHSFYVLIHSQPERAAWLAMLLVVQVMIVILIRFRGIDTTMMFKNRLINRNVHALNQNLKGVFHSFKNTIFTVKILSIASRIWR
ncbi:hypothetical protein [Paenibacillus chungangensis]|uniref:Uncharacterized protein n=1 Tax=Paenibacillus chungangensis TaxID=696535 RepID=A0ABW3HT13_9BACL